MDTVDSLAKNHFDQPDVIKDYMAFKWLLPSELTVFETCQAHICGKRILDIGCGGGRMTEHLKSLTSQYVGLDYSEDMLQICKAQYPEATFIQCDATDMSVFAEPCFDFVLFAFNSIDTMSHDKRIKVLYEIYRILKPGSVFAFSTHNRDYKKIVKAFNPYYLFSLDAIRQNIRNVRSYLKVRKAQVFADTYDIISDPLAGFGLLIYNIKKQDQVRQLTEVGFCEIQIINSGGKFVETTERDRENPWLYYVCRKPFE
jgi:ubiquinone/menaquinone biosynthesis C-methylase UbiE